MIISTLSLKMLFDNIYIEFIYKYFAYETFTLSYNQVNQIVSYIIITLTVISLYILEKDNRGTKIPLYILFFSLLLPLSTIAAYESMEIKYYLYIMFSYNMIVILLVFTPDINLKWPDKQLMDIPLLFMFGIYIYTYSMLLLNGGFTRINFNLDEVYETRELLEESSFPFSNYFISWIGYSFNPILIILGLYNKNKTLFYFGLILQILLFGMTNFKSFLFSIPLMIFIYYIAKLKNHFLVICIGVISLLLLLNLLFILTNDITLSSILIRRQFFVPAHLHYLYNDFFTRNPLIYLSDSIFKYFVTYPYSDGVTRIIGVEYWGKRFGPNVGFFGNAFYNFGYNGILFFSLLLFIFIKIVNSLEAKVPKNLICSIILVPFMALINSGFLTTLLTHSLLISAVSIWLMGAFINKERV